MEPSQEKYKEETIRGVKWNLIEQVLVYVIVLVGTVFLSRILLPEEFGLFGMLTVLANLATLVVGMGLGYSIIQNKTLEENDVSTIFWFNILLGSGVAVAFFLGAPFIASFYRQPDLVAITRIFCFGFLIQGANSVPQALLIKKLHFKKLAMANITAAIISYSLSIFLGLNGYGVWALVAQFLTLHSITVSMNFFLSAWYPNFVFNFSGINKIKKFSANLFASQLIDFSASNLDVVLIGKYTGKRDLGFFGRATALVTIPITSLGFVLNRTFFPWFSSLQNKKEDLQYRYLQALRVLTFIILPVLVLVGVLSEEVILLLFGKQWVPVASVVSILAIYASFLCINSFHDSFLISQGRTDVLLKVSMIEKAMMIAGVIIGLKFGIEGIAWAKTVVIGCIFGPRVWTVCRVTGVSIQHWLKNILSLTIAVGVLLIVAIILKQAFSGVNFFLRLISVTVPSLAVYYFMLIGLKEKALYDVQQVFVDQLKKAFKK